MRRPIPCFRCSLTVSFTTPVFLHVLDICCSCCVVSEGGAVWHQFGAELHRKHVETRHQRSIKQEHTGSDSKHSLQQASCPGYSLSPVSQKQPVANIHFQDIDRVQERSKGSAERKVFSLTSCPDAFNVTVKLKREVDPAWLGSSATEDTSHMT